MDTCEDCGVKKKGRILSEDHKRKISEAHKGKKQSEAHKRKLSASRKGSKRTKETKRKMSEALKGRVHTEESKIKMSEARKGKKHTEDAKRKISEGNKGKRFGMKHSEETKAKISKVHKGKTVSEEARRKISKVHKGKVTTRETKEKMRDSHIKYIEEKHFEGQPMYPRIGTNETKALDMIEYKLDIKLERQYQVIGYFLDGYDKQNNVVYEVDEKHHFTKEQKHKDKIRQENIMKELNCAWVSIIDKGLCA